MTQEQVGAAVHMVAQNVGKLERGELELKVSQLPAFADALQVEVADLLPSDTTRGFTRASVPLVGHVFVRRNATGAPSDLPPPHDRVPLPRALDKPDQCFAVRVLDGSADRLYGVGSLLFCREIEQPIARLRLGAKLVLRRFGTDLATGDGLDLLFGTLDRSSQGGLLVNLHSHDRSAPDLVRLRPHGRPTLTAIDGGTALDYAAELSQLVDYRPEPSDLALIVGLVELAIIPQ